MLKIKQVPQDFIVKEANKLTFDESGQYSYYLLKKTDYNTVDAIKAICKAFGINEKYVNFAGTKDKAAVTEQYISINKGPKKDLALKDIELRYLGKGNERLNLGSLKGNYFQIVVRNIDKKPLKKDFFVNYFDEQRFGKNKDNHIVGKHIIKGEFDNACALIKEAKDQLEKRPGDFIGALWSLPKKILKLYVHAYQSHLWNIAAEEISKNSKENIRLPIIGFGTEFENEKIRSIYDKILKKEGISLRDFVIKKMPELSEEGTVRDLFIKAEKLETGKLEDDELNNGKKKLLIKFFLPKGAYATNVVKTLFE